MLTIGSILYISLLLINATAVLSEERFLARSESSPLSFRLRFLMYTVLLQSAGHLYQRSQALDTTSRTHNHTHNRTIKMVHRRMLV